MFKFRAAILLSLNFKVKKSEKYEYQVLMRMTIGLPVLVSLSRGLELNEGPQVFHLAAGAPQHNDLYSHKKNFFFKCQITVIFFVKKK